MKLNAKVIIAICIIAFFIGIGLAIHDNQKQKIMDNLIQNNVVNTVENEIVSTTEIPELTEEDEQVLEVQETNLENEGFERQGEVAYNGASSTPNIELGKYQGLTYYSQADSRWANHMYSAINDRSQTIMSSGCGPTSAAMIVSSIRGTITPPEMGNLFVEYGYRSTNNGTYFSAMKWVADVFDITYQETYSLNTVVDLLEKNYYVVVSCNEGLFTYGGHFIVIVGIDGDTLKIYDPYLYSGKFDVSSRRGKATVKGNTVYVTVDNFRKYANATKFYAYLNDRDDTKENTSDVTITDNNNSSVTSVNYKVKVNTSVGLNIRSGASTSYSIIGGYANGTKVTITAEKGNWGKTNKGWICLDYTSKLSSGSSSKKYTTGRYEISANVLTVRSGAGTNYSWKEYSQLTSNAQRQILNECGYKPNGLVKGVQCDVSQIKGNWGKIPSGWICLDYCKKI